jgi:hypothetical protein
LRCEEFSFANLDFLANRAAVIANLKPDEKGVVRWVHESPTPLEIPGANLIFDALAK